MATNALAQMLDELMGRDRNLAPTEKRCELRWDDPEVCKYYLVAFCPHDLFVNTRADLGICSKLHDDSLRKGYQKSTRFEKMGYEEDFIRFLTGLITDVEKRIRRGHQRLQLNLGMQAQQNGNMSSAKEERIEMLTERINELVQQAEDLGCEGKVEEAQGVMKLCDQLKDERVNMEESKLSSSSQEPEKTMEVCTVCGALLVVGDVQQRIDEHLMGKQHAGYARIRATVEEWKQKRIKTEEDREARILKEREDREKEREKEREERRQRELEREKEREKEREMEREREKEKEREKERERRKSRSRSRRRSRDRKRSTSRDRKRKSRSRSRHRRHSRSRSRDRDHKKSRRHRSRSRGRRSGSRGQRKRSHSREAKKRSRSRESKKRSRSRESKRRSHSQDRKRSQSPESKRRSGSGESKHRSRSGESKDKDRSEKSRKRSNESRDGDQEYGGEKKMSSDAHDGSRDVGNPMEAQLENAIKSEGDTQKSLSD